MKLPNRRFNRNQGIYADMHFSPEGEPISKLRSLTAIEQGLAAQRDAGFSLFYMGINFGALFGPLICGWLGEDINWHLGFSLAGIGMVAGLIQYKMTERYLGDAGEMELVVGRRCHLQIDWGESEGAYGELRLVTRTLAPATVSQKMTVSIASMIGKPTTRLVTSRSTVPHMMNIKDSDLGNKKIDKTIKLNKKEI